MNIIKKIRNISIGWYRRIFHKSTDIALKRLEICNKCPHKKLLLGEDFCSLCWCPTHSKVLVEDEKCYDNRW